MEPRSECAATVQRSTAEDARRVSLHDCWVCCMFAECVASLLGVYHACLLGVYHVCLCSIYAVCNVHASEHWHACFYYLAKKVKDLAPSTSANQPSGCTGLAKYSACTWLGWSRLPPASIAAAWASMAFLHDAGECVTVFTELVRKLVSPSEVLIQHCHTQLCHLG